MSSLWFLSLSHLRYNINRMFINELFIKKSRTRVNAKSKGARWVSPICNYLFSKVNQLCNQPNISPLERYLPSIALLSKLRFLDNISKDIPVFLDKSDEKTIFNNERFILQTFFQLKENCVTLSSLTMAFENTSTKKA